MVCRKKNYRKHPKGQYIATKIKHVLTKCHKWKSAGIDKNSQTFETFSATNAIMTTKLFNEMMREATGPEKHFNTSKTTMQLILNGVTLKENYNSLGERTKNQILNRK